MRVYTEGLKVSSQYPNPEHFLIANTMRSSRPRDLLVEAHQAFILFLDRYRPDPKLVCTGCGARVWGSDGELVPHEDDCPTFPWNEPD